MNIKIEEIVAALINDEVSGAEAIADLHAIVKAGQATLRDEFAKAALIATSNDPGAYDVASRATLAYMTADAMLSQREKA